MKKIYELRYLSNKLSIKYPRKDYPEFLFKQLRPYIVFLIEVDSHIFAIPFRTNINHNYSYIFSKTSRETHNSTGLDFTKAVLVDDETLLGSEARIDDKEYAELNKRYFYIRNQFIKYYNGFKKYIRNDLNCKQTEAYKYSTLKYFQKELNIK